MPSIEDHIYDSMKHLPCGPCKLTQKEQDLLWDEIYRKRKEQWKAQDRENIRKARENNLIGAMIYDTLVELLREVKKLREVL